MANVAEIIWLKPQPQNAKPTILGYLEASTLGRKLPPINFPQVSQNLPEVSLPIYGFKLLAGATTGFASPAQDYETVDELDLTAFLIKNKPSTFLFPVGKDYDSMIDDGILPGSMLIVDRSLKVKHASIVVAAVDGEWVVKRLYKRNGLLQLHSSNRDKNYPPIEFKEGQELYIFGVVKDAINKLA
jgi:DNA polymerase V